jgi:signal recognition particle subunit SRP54
LGYNEFEVRKLAFGSLTERLKHIFSKLTGTGKLTELEIKSAMREIKLALLEADVNLLVVKDFVAKCSEKCTGESVMKSLTPGQQIIKIVNDELVELLGKTAEKLKIAEKPPTVIMMVGLQGAGKTTFCGKLGYLLKGQSKRVLLVACDIYRPAAVEQLKIVGKTAGAEVYSENTKDAVRIAKNGVKHALANNYDTVIIDTAGRLHIDENLMEELARIKKESAPAEILLTVDAMTGQDAVNVATEFNNKLDITGILLTKLDGDTRGGAALSIRAVTGKPIKFTGIGEKIGDIEVFHPDRIARRILGMGDVITIIEKAQATVSEAELKKLEQNFKSNSFTLQDFLLQFESVKKMGDINDLMENLGGALGNKVKIGGQIDDAAITRNKAIIQSMTRAERINPEILKSGRKQRIAKGSGTTIQEINQLLKQFEQSKLLMKQFGGGKRRFR